MANFRETAASRARDDGERLLARRLCDLSERADRTGVVTSTGFLTPAEQDFARMVEHLLPCPLTLDGGFDGAERCVARFGEYGERPVAGLAIAHRTPLGHRDLLGAALGLGLERSVVGDIIPGETASRMVVLRSQLGFFLNSFDKAGRVPLEVSELPLDEFQPPERRVERVVLSLASMRLDALVAAAWGLSREDAQGEITRGMVQQNHRPQLEPSRRIAEGDTISLRGKGKLTVGAALGITRRDRLRIEVEKYI